MYLIELDDVGMADQFENVNFSGDPLHVRDIHYFLLFKDLNCYLWKIRAESYFLPSKIVISKFDFTKCAFANSFAYEILRNPTAMIGGKTYRAHNVPHSCTVDSLSPLLVLPSLLVCWAA